MSTTPLPVQVSVTRQARNQARALPAYSRECFWAYAYVLERQDGRALVGPGVVPNKRYTGWLNTEARLRINQSVVLRKRGNQRTLKIKILRVEMRPPVPYGRLVPRD